MSDNKRFKNIGTDIFQYGEWWCSANGEHCADVIATAMNRLINENEQLKKENKQLKRKQRLDEALSEFYCKDRKLEKLNVSIECCDEGLSKNGVPKIVYKQDKRINRDCLKKIKDLFLNKLKIDNKLFECENEINKRLYEVIDNPYFSGNTKYVYDDLTSEVQIKISSEEFNAEIIDNLNSFFRTNSKIITKNNEVILIYDV